jgi:hypothetical protein
MRKSYRKPSKSKIAGMICVQVNGSNWTGNVPCTSASATASSAAATVNADCGVVTTEALTGAAGATEVVTLTNSKIIAGTTVRASLVDYSGTLSTNGIPVVNVTDIDTAAHTAVLAVSNAHGANALNGVAKILFEVVTLPV